jgi:uncharacterized protein (DUF2336 family)
MSSSSTQEQDSSGRLLRSLVAQFAGRERHRLEELRQFERLVGDLFDIVDVKTIAAVAEALCRHPETPPALVERLFGFGGETARVALRHAPKPSEQTLRIAAERGLAEHALAVASRPALSREIVAALVARADHKIARALAGNSDVRLDPASLRVLTQLGRDDPTLARSLLDRNAPELDRAALFLAATREERAGIVVAACRAALIVGAGDAPPRDYGLVAELEGRALASDLDGFVAALATGLEARRPRVRALVHDAGGEPLALALRGLGAGVDRATRVLLAIDLPISADTLRLRALRAMISSTPIRAAAQLVGSMTGAARVERDPSRRALPLEETATQAAGRRRGAGRTTAEPARKAASEEGA